MTGKELIEIIKEKGEELPIAIHTKNGPWLLDESSLTVDVLPLDIEEYGDFYADMKELEPESEYLAIVVSE